MINLSILARMDALRAKREALGFNVHFIRDDGTPDCFSFRTAERANAFRASLVRQGRTIIGSN